MSLNQRWRSLGVRGRGMGFLLAWVILGGAESAQPAVSAATPPTQPQTGYGRVAHWPLDEDYRSTVFAEWYSGEPQGGPHLSIDRADSAACVGAGSLRIHSGPQGGNATHLAIGYPLTGHRGSEVFTVVGWYRYADLGGDGSDPRNFVWETYPAYALSFGLRDYEGQRHAEWWVETESHGALSEVRGPQVTPGVWYHVALVWNQLSGHVRFYHQGILVHEKAIPEGATLAWTEGFRIGNHRAGNGERDWDGHLDDLAVFDVELSPRQIQGLVEDSGGPEGITAGNVLERLPEPTWQQLVERPEQPVWKRPSWHVSHSQGPLLGHVDEHQAVIWLRQPGKRNVELVLQEVSATGGSSERVIGMQTGPEQDWCLHFHLDGLQPATGYRYGFRAAGQALREGRTWTFRTPPPASQPARVRLGFGSCADFSDSPIWTRLIEEEVEGMVLLGDTPYIDTTDLPAVRNAYRRFSSIPRLVQAFQVMPFWGTWDDHDFGLNDSDGRLPGKEFTRQGFVEYRPNRGFGQEDLGVYTSFRRGPVEVFLLDTRWFARTEDSWADPARPTLLGRRQWEWLQAGLKASTATFKLLACGMIWDDKKNRESDDWGTYDYERQALQSWLGAQGISGVVLIGGDIHVSRLLRYSTREQVGYDLMQWIVSPLHDRVIPSLNVPHPHLVSSAVEPRVFLRVTADSTVEPATLEAEWIHQDGRRFFSVRTDARELSSAP